jgi:secondary thiamine-phosphate synthase enzyme
MFQRTIEVPTGRRGLFDVTRQIAELVKESGVRVGLCHVFIQHTSASLVIQENASPDVLHDLDDWYSRAAPDGDPRFRHTEEGPDDMSAHVRASLTDTTVTIPVTEGKLAFGTWQALYIFEHRTAPTRRRLVVTIQG